LTGGLLPATDPFGLGFTGDFAGFGFAGLGGFIPLPRGEANAGVGCFAGLGIPVGDFVRGMGFAGLGIPLGDLPRLLGVGRGDDTRAEGDTARGIGELARAGGDCVRLGEAFADTAGLTTAGLTATGLGSVGLTAVGLDPL